MTDEQISAIMGWPMEHMQQDRDPLSLLARVRAVVAAAEAGERAQAEADAARYRWLRDNTEGTWAICEWADDADGIGFYRDSRKPGTVVDSAIDAAMREG